VGRMTRWSFGATCKFEMKGGLFGTFLVLFAFLGALVISASYISLCFRSLNNSTIHIFSHNISEQYVCLKLVPHLFFKLLFSRDDYLQ
jgi:hypothetical protein